MKWFKHDSDASSDAKLEKLILKHGVSGYGLYFYCLELIARGVDTHNITFELEHDAEIIVHRLRMSSDLVADMMVDMVNLGLFENDGGRITCLKMRTRTDDYIGRIVTKELRSNSEQTTSKVVVNRIEEKRIDKNIKAQGVKPKAPPVPYQKIIDLYHEKLPTNPHVIKLNDSRKRQIKARHVNNVKSLDDWSEYFQIVSESKFLTGQQPPGYGRSKPFVADIDFLIKEINLLKIIEGKYHE